MANYYYSDFIVVGDRNQLLSLHNIMKELENAEDSLVENEFGNTWLGNLVIKLGGDWKKVYCRGSWNDLEIENDFSKLYFSFDIGHGSVQEMIQFINSRYPDIQLYYMTTDYTCFETNDTTGVYFPERYCFGLNGWWDFYTLEDLKKEVEEITGNIVPSNTFLDCKHTFENYLSSIIDIDPDNEGVYYNEEDESYAYCHMARIFDYYSSQTQLEKIDYFEEKPLFSLF